MFRLNLSLLVKNISKNQLNSFRSIQNDNHFYITTPIFYVNSSKSINNYLNKITLSTYFKYRATFRTSLHISCC